MAEIAVSVQRMTDERMIVDKKEEKIEEKVDEKLAKKVEAETKKVDDCCGITEVSEWDWLLNVTCKDISAIYVTVHR